MLQERHLTAGTAELLKQQNLVGVAPRQPVGAQYRDMLNGTVADGVAQGVEAGSVEAGAPVTFIPEEVLLCDLVSCSCGPAPQGGELAVNGLLALLALGRDAGIEGGAHGGLTSAVAQERANGEVSRRRRETGSSRSRPSRDRIGMEWILQVAVASAQGRFGIGLDLCGRLARPNAPHLAQGNRRSRGRRRRGKPAPPNGSDTTKRTASIAFGSCTSCVTVATPPRRAISSSPPA